MSIEQYKQYEPLFGDWYITKELGQGYHGTVFEIERKTFGVTFKAALKVITIPRTQSEYEQFISSSGFSKDDAYKYYRDYVQELVRKIAITAPMKCDKNIVGVDETQVIEHTDSVGWDILIRMELLTPLDDYLQQHDFKEQDVIKMGINICQALEACQKYKIIHRDIKPENIFFSKTGDWKLGDFFNACMIEKESKVSDRTGVVPYMAPEIYRGEPYGCNADIYSLGLLMYRLMNKNRLPFFPPAPQPMTYADREEAIRLRMDGKAVPPPVDASRPLAEVICRACEPDPQVRYQSAAEMRISLEKLLAKDDTEKGDDKPVNPVRMDDKERKTDADSEKEKVLRNLFLLKAGMKTFAEADHKDKDALKLIVFALAQAPLYLPIAIDIPAMLGKKDPKELKPGDTIHIEKDTRIKFATVTIQDTDFGILFSDKSQAGNNNPTSMIRMYACDYVPIFLKMDCDAIIDPFGSDRFVLTKQLMKDVLLPVANRIKDGESKAFDKEAETEAEKESQPKGNLSQNNETDKKPRQGFFSKLFSKKKSGITGESVIHEVCSQIKDDKAKDLFYGDIGSAEKILLSLTESSFSAVTKENAALCLQIYIRTWIQSHGGLDIRFMMPDSICESAYGAFPKVERGIVRKCVDESLKVIYSHEPELKQRIDQVSKMQQYIAEIASKNVAIENQYTEDDDFGKVPEKPIFVNGFGQDRAYLDRLYTSDGVKLHNERKGSITVEGIAGPVDVYHLLQPDGQLYMEIYISNYGQHTAQVSPKGTQLKYDNMK